MKVLIFSNNDVGLYKFRKELINKLLKNGHDVDIALPYGKKVDQLIDIGCRFFNTPIDRRGINPLVDIVLIFKCFFVLRKSRPDLVVSYTIKPNIYAGILCRIMGIKYAINITGLGYTFQKDNWLKTVLSALYKFVCYKASTVFFENAANRKVFLELKIVTAEKTCLLNGAGVNTLEYAFEEYPADKNVIRILFVGRLMKDKGIDELLEAMQQSKARYGELLEFAIIGSYEDNYKNIIEEKAGKGELLFYGFQDDVKPFISRAHCVVLPSYHEGMSNVLLEAAAMGRPIITTNIPGCRETIVDGQSGLLCNVQDSFSLYSQICRFVELPYAQKASMGRMSRVHIEKNFDKKDVVNNTIDRLDI